MYGKHFAQMYEGSMVGAGPVVFAVMGYVIAKQVPDRTVGSQVELNPKLLAYILGAEQGQVEEAIEKLCAPDPDSRSPEHEGRRLIKIGQFAYQVVNGQKYRWMMDEEKRRLQNREAKARERARKKSQPLTREQRYVLAEQRGDFRTADAIAAEGLPEPTPPPSTESVGPETTTIPELE